MRYKSDTLYEEIILYLMVFMHMYNVIRHQ